MNLQQDLLRRAAALIRDRALQFDDERWMVDQDEHGRLIIGTYGPEDVDPDTGTSTSIVADLSYGDEPGAPAIAVPAANHIAGLDPATGVMLADWLDTAADQWSGGRLDQAALRMARVYLRDTEGGDL